AELLVVVGDVASDVDVMGRRLLGARAAVDLNAVAAVARHLVVDDPDRARASADVHPVGVLIEVGADVAVVVHEVVVHDDVVDGRAGDPALDAHPAAVDIAVQLAVTKDDVIAGREERQRSGLCRVQRPELEVLEHDVRAAHLPVAPDDRTAGGARPADEHGPAREVGGGERVGAGAACAAGRSAGRATRNSTPGTSTSAYGPSKRRVSASTPPNRCTTSHIGTTTQNIVFRGEGHFA